MPELVATRVEDRLRRATRGAVVGAVGVAVPAHAVPNSAIAEQLGVSEEWIVARTGVHERRVAGPAETVVDYASVAAARSLAGADVDPSEVDLVLVATMSGDQLSPNASAVVASRIGASGAGALDINAACSGFVSALALAAGQVESGRARTVLVIGADLMHRLTDPADRGTAALFADGAGAVLVRASGYPGSVGPAVLGSDGARGDLVTVDRAEAIIRMNGHDTFRQAVDRLSESAAAAAAAAGVPLSEIDLFAFHQANGRILSAVAERLGLDRERVIDCIDRYGNTSAATIPIALADADSAGRLEPGSVVLLAAFGGGLTWSATVIEWDRPAAEGGDDA